MTKSTLLGMALALGAAFLPVENHGQAQGPAEQPSFRNPFLEPAAPPSGLPFPLNQQAVAGNAGPSTMAREPAANQPDPNLDILVTDKQGPWMIYVTSYSGPEAAIMARQMVMELRSNHRVPAYVFNRGAEERRKEDARVKGIIEKQRQFLAEKGLPLNTPLRVKRMQIEQQCAVLVGDYPDDDSARRGLNEIRKLKPLDPNRVKLDRLFNAVVDEKTGNSKVKEEFVNPFKNAFVIRNPLLKVDRPKDLEQSELAAMKLLNRGEDYSLFNCQKPYTLMVKQFLTPNVTQPSSASGSFLAALGLGKTAGDGIDTAAHNAHNLAELMRKSFQLEAYVLHTRHSSIVTVGGFEGLADPHMRSTQEMLTNRLKVPSVRPMPVPR